MVRGRRQGHGAPLSPLNLPNPNSGIGGNSSDGRHFMVYNHLKSGRHMLNTAISDDGINWKPVALLRMKRREANSHIRQ